MNNETRKRNVDEFNSDVASFGGYKYTTNAPYSSVVANRRIIDATIALIPKSVKSIVDIGCGDGTYTGDLALRFPGVEILGLDPAAEAVARSQRLIPEVSFAVGDVLVPETLPQRKFDVGIIRGVVHHLPDGPRGIANAARICRTLIVIEPNGNNPILKWIEQHSRYHIEHEEQSFTSRELEVWCRSAGYGKVKMEYIGFVPFFFPTALSKIIHFFQPLLECIYPLNKYFSAQIVLLCEEMEDKASSGTSPKKMQERKTA